MSKIDCHLEQIQFKFTMPRQCHQPLAHHIHRVRHQRFRRLKVQQVYLRHILRCIRQLLLPHLQYHLRLLQQEFQPTFQPNHLLVAQQRFQQKYRLPTHQVHQQLLQAIVQLSHLHIAIVVTNHITIIDSNCIAN